MLRVLQGAVQLCCCLPATDTSSTTNHAVMLNSGRLMHLLCKDGEKSPTYPLQAASLPTYHMEESSTGNLWGEFNPNE